MKKILISLLVTTLLIMPVDSVKAQTSYTDYQREAYLQSASEAAMLPSMSVVIVDAESVLFSGTYGDCDSIDTPYIIGSMSKSFTAICIMQLVEQEKISLDEKISRYLPGVANGDQITVRQLLNQTSGLGEHQNLNNIKITDSYGTHQYANVNYSLLGKIIEAVSSMSYEEYVSSHIFLPLDMAHSAASLEKSKENGLINGHRNYFGLYVAGEPDYPDENSWSQVPAGYLSASASDMGKYLQMYLNGGEGIVTQDSIDIVFYDNVYVDGDTPYYYGMGWMLSELYEAPILEHSGLVENYMSKMFILPESGIGVAVLVNANDFLVTNSMMDQISASLVFMLMGENPIEISKTQYLSSHLLLDGIYLLIFLAACLPLLFLKHFQRKLPGKSLRKTVILACLLHILLPTCLLLFPRFLGIPLWVVRSYVNDLYLVLIISSVLLYAGGILKTIFLLRFQQIKLT